LEIVEVAHLHKSSGATVAVNYLSLTLADAKVVGLLGLNGAGETTTVEIIVGLCVPDAGKARVLRPDPLLDHARLRAPRLPGCELERPCSSAAR
jgi:ABC-2 type transport system ATP-binding protein